MSDAIKSPLELALSKLAAAMGRGPSPDEPTPSATSLPPAASPPPGSASKSPSPFGALDLGTSRPYEPLTSHPDFQTGKGAAKEQEDLLNKVFSKVGQNPDPDRFFLRKPGKSSLSLSAAPAPRGDLPNNNKPFVSLVKRLFGRRVREPRIVPSYQKHSKQAAADLMSAARAIEDEGRKARAEKVRQAREAGIDKRLTGGTIGRAALLVYEALLFRIWPICNEVMRPSVAHIADMARCSVRTVYRALKVLSRLGLLWYQQGPMHMTTQEDGTRVYRRETSSYVLGQLHGLAVLGAAVCAPWTSGTGCQFGRGMETSKRLLEATASETDRARPP